MASISESEKKWSATAQLYIRHFESFTVAMGVKLLTSMNMHFPSDSVNIIECGCGSGGLGLEIFRLLASGEFRPEQPHRLCMVDLSESMTELARTRMAKLSGTCMDIELELKVADATSLGSLYADGSFDRYICNMTLHYAPDGDALLREAARLLARGGIAGFTVWGHEAESEAFTLLPRVKVDLGLAPVPTPGNPQPRSNFHMGEDDDAMRARVLAAGFEHCVVWHALSVVEAVSATAFVHRMTEGAYSTKQELEQWTDSQRTAFLGRVWEEAQTRLQAGKPLGLDVCYIIATK
jgi:ubiquinone/menaquinone biosynthesis C-methylase UbiE